MVKYQQHTAIITFSRELFLWYSKVDMVYQKRAANTVYGAPSCDAMNNTDIL